MSRIAYFLFPVLFITCFLSSNGQTATDSTGFPDKSKWGKNDTIIVPAVYYNGEWMAYSEMEMVYISKLPPDKLAKLLEKYNRLRNAVYVTYPYARIAGRIINDVNAHLEGVNAKRDRKKYIKSRESELKK